MRDEPEDSELPKPTLKPESTARATYQRSQATLSRGHILTIVATLTDTFLRLRITITPASSYLH